VDLGELRELVAAATGEIPCDLVVRGVRLLNVHTGEVLPVDIGVKGGRVVQVAPDLPPGEREFAGQGLYAIPGFIDSHMHIESTLLTPASLAAAIVPHGTTCLLADPHEIANVAGPQGIRDFLGLLEGLPYRVFLQVPSRVPTAPGLETTGGYLDLPETEELLALPQSVALGELDPAKVLPPSAEHLAKVLYAQRAGRPTSGHAAGLTGPRLQAYAAAGLSDDHECVSFEELSERLRLGMTVLVREGSSERNLEELIAGVVREKLPTDGLCFCTDDKHPADILREGHLDWCVNRAIELGLSPWQAIRMASWNPARHFRLERDLGTIAPGSFADFLLCPTLAPVEPRYVFVGGRLVAAEGELLEAPSPPSPPPSSRGTVRLKRTPTKFDFLLPAAGEEVQVRVIELIPGQIVNRAGTATLQVAGGHAQPDLEGDVLPVACLERYGKTGNVALAFVRGFGLRRGAIASSVAHDHHNLLVVGTDPEDMLAAVKALVESQGGFVAVEGGEVRARLPLPWWGLLSARPLAEVVAGLEEVRAAARALGCPLPTPFMSLSFLGLPTVPELGLTDLGLVDVRAHRLVPVRLP
jgi:adenine deaminase